MIQNYSDGSDDDGGSDEEGGSKEDGEDAADADVVAAHARALQSPRDRASNSSPLLRLP